METSVGLNGLGVGSRGNGVIGSTTDGCGTVISFPGIIISPGFGRVGATKTSSFASSIVPVPSLKPLNGVSADISAVSGTGAFSCLQFDNLAGTSPKVSLQHEVIKQYRIFLSVS